MEAIANKAVLVTGGTRGIGFAIARELLHRGARVFLCGTTEKSVERALDKLREAGSAACLGMACNVRDFRQVAGMMKEAGNRLGGLDVLINNAGVGRFENVESLSPELWNETIETNLSGVFYCCHEAIPLLKRRGGGYIINIGSLAGKNAFPGGSAYNASKFGLIGFSEALMQEVRYDHIRVSYVMPGSVATEFGGPTASARSQGWKLQPEDVVEVIVNLLEMNPRALPSRVEIRPSEPKK